MSTRATRRYITSGEDGFVDKDSCVDVDRLCVLFGAGEAPIAHFECDTSSQARQGR